jgi:SPP1 gp7 family putative phage head morphogenesis protein
MLRDYRAAIIGREESQLERLARAWIEVEQKLKNDMELLAYEIAEAQAAGNVVVTAQLIRRMERWQVLKAQMRDEIEGFVDEYVANDIAVEQTFYANMGILAASDSIESLAYGAAFDRLPKRALSDYVGSLQPGSPLNNLLKEAYPDAIDGVMTGLLDGFARGLGPKEIARNMADKMGIGLHRITTIARTEQLRAYRTSSVQQYRESGIVKGFRRLATKDDRTCEACLFSDGEFFEVEAELTDHPNGRCAAVPVLNSGPEVTWETGEEWFMEQDAEWQEEYLGPEKYELWQEGQIQLGDLVGTSHSDTWGDAPSTVPVKDIKPQDEPEEGSETEEQ